MSVLLCMPALGPKSSDAGYRCKDASSVGANFGLIIQNALGSGMRDSRP